MKRLLDSAAASSCQDSAHMFVRGVHFNSLVSTSAQSNGEALINSLPPSTRLCPSSLHLKDSFLP